MDFKGYKRKKINDKMFYLITPSIFNSLVMSSNWNKEKNKRQTIKIRNLKAKIAYYKKSLGNKIYEIDRTIEMLTK